MRKNSLILFTVAATTPGLAMIAAHYAPWRKALGRDLHRLEAYAIGVGSTCGVSAALLASADSDDPPAPSQNAAIVLLAAASAGVATLAAWALDHQLETWHQLLDEVDRAQRRHTE